MSDRTSIDPKTLDTVAEALESAKAQAVEANRKLAHVEAWLSAAVALGRELTARAEKAEAERDATIARAEKEREGWARELAASERRGMCLAECLAERDTARADCAAMREALAPFEAAEQGLHWGDDITGYDLARASAALSGTAGRELAADLARLRRVEAAARAYAVAAGSVPTVCGEPECPVCVAHEVLVAALAEGAKGGGT